MDEEESLDETLLKKLIACSRRDRSKNFTLMESEALVDLVTQHRTVLDRSNTSAANYAKDTAWAAITQEYNLRCQERRTAENLMLRWRNLKSRARKTRIAQDDSEYAQVYSRVRALTSDSGSDFKDFSADDENADDVENSVDHTDYADNYEENATSQNSGQNNEKLRRRDRSKNFTMEESETLLELVRQNRAVLDHSNTATAIYDKESAWAIITEQFNERLSEYRTTDSLMVRWRNMKKRSKRQLDERDDSSGENALLATSVAALLSEIGSNSKEHSDELESSVGRAKASENKEVWAEHAEHNASVRNNGVSPEKLRRRDQSKNLNTEESNVLVELMERYRTSLLTPQGTVTGNRAAWVILTRQYNTRGFPEHRDAQTLQSNWRTLKLAAMEQTRNLTEVRYSEYDPLMCRVVALLCEAGANTKLELNAESENADEMENSENSCHSELDEDRARENRSLNFTPQECNRLLQCVKAERRVIFSKDTTSKGVRQKNQAWERVSEAFNKNNVNHRPTKVLRTKFENMKKMARNVVAGRTEKITRKRSASKDLGIRQVVKKEKEDEMDYGEEDEDTFTTHDDFINVQPSLQAHAAPSADPLSVVLNGYSDNDCHQYRDNMAGDNPEIIKLKTDLLNYQLETAKLERQRVVAATESDSVERAQRARLLALRLREARLNAAAAEQHFPPGHPALHYPSAEQSALPPTDQYPLQ